MAAKSMLPLLLGAGVVDLVLTRKKKTKPIPEDYFNGYFAEGATVGAAEGLGDIEKAVTLDDIVMRDTNGDMHEISKGVFNPDGSAALNFVDVSKDASLFGEGSLIERVVTNFYGPGARAFENEVMDEFIEGPESADPSDPEAAEAVTLAVLQRLRPLINWNATPEGSVEEMVLDGGLIITEIVQQNLPGGGA